MNQVIVKKIKNSSAEMAKEFYDRSETILLAQVW